MQMHAKVKYFSPDKKLPVYCIVFYWQKDLFQVLEVKNQPQDDLDNCDGKEKNLVRVEKFLSFFKSIII